MEDLEYHLNEGTSNGDNKNKIFLSISILSWLAFLVTSWLSLGLPYSWKVGKIIWFTLSINFEKKELKDLGATYQYIPITLLYEFHYVVFILAFSFSTIGFLIFMLYKEDENIVYLMFGKYSKFHFIPLLCISALFILTESIDLIDKIISNIRIDFNGYDYDYDEDNVSNPFSLISESRFIFNFIFTLIALASLIFISFTTKIKLPRYPFLSITKGTYSCLIPLLVYNFFYSIFAYVIFKLVKKEKNTDDWMKASGITFSLVIGIANSILSFVLKDIMISFMNVLIYIGMLIYFFKIDREKRENYNEFADGIIDIVVLTGSVAIIVFLSFQWKKIYTDD